MSGRGSQRFWDRRVGKPVARDPQPCARRAGCACGGAIRSAGLPPEVMRTAGKQALGLRGQEAQAREGGAIKPVLESQQPVSKAQGVRPNHEIREDAPWAGIRPSPTPGSVHLKGHSCGTPSCLIKRPVNSYAGLAEEAIEKSYLSSGCCHQFGENRSRHHQRSVGERLVQNGLRGRAQGGIRVPERNNHVGINGGGHRPRNSLSHRAMAFFPEPIPGFPIPRYFAKGLSSRTGRTRIASPSPSKATRSPGFTPSARRTSHGSVIWPLLVILACL